MGYKYCLVNLIKRTDGMLAVFIGNREMQI